MAFLTLQSVSNAASFSSPHKFAQSTKKCKLGIRFDYILLLQTRWTSTLSKMKTSIFLKRKPEKERINWCDLKDLFYVIPARWDGNFFKMVGLKTGKEGEKFSLRLTNHLGRNQIFTWPKFVGSIELWSLLSATKFQNVFVQIAKYICPNCKMYLSKLFLHHHWEEQEGW